jgi:hypothetical protein
VRRIAIELPIGALAAAIMASIVACAGAAIEPMSQPAARTDLTDAPDGGAARCLEAPVTAPSAMGQVGTSTLCYDHYVLRAMLLVHDLAPGPLYTVWLVYQLPPAACPDTSCAPVGLLTGSPSGLMQLLGGAVAPPSGMLEIHGQLQDVRLVRGARVSLMLLRPGGKAGPHAQAELIVP